MRPLTVLMLGGAKHVSLAKEFIKAGKGTGHDVQIFSVEQTNFQPVESVGKIILGGKFTSPRALIDLNQIISAYHADIILPFTDDAVELSSRSQIRHPEVYIPICNYETILNLTDKAKSAKLFTDNGIPTPEIFSNGSIKYPVICRFRSYYEDSKLAFSDDDIKKIEIPDNYIFQEYIKNRDEYTVDCFIGKDNEIKSIVPRICISKTGHDVIRTQTCRIPQLIGMSKFIIEKLNLTGAITLHIIYNKDNNRFLLINAKPSIDNGVMCSIKAGANSAEMILKESQGEKVTPIKLWRDGALMTRYLQEVMFFTDGNR